MYIFLACVNHVESGNNDHDSERAAESQSRQAKILLRAFRDAQEQQTGEASKLDHYLLVFVREILAFSYFLYRIALDY